ncbi:MAG: TonB-dependent receptor [Pseudomonadales bacterium]|nr:TonB-dependent receptor [Pseudomonadales bacterium]
MQKFLTCSVAVACAWASSLGASAEPARSARSALMEEIVVTATKKNVVEGVQDVPIAISAFSGTQLQALKIKDLQDIGMLVPNANLQPITRKGTAFFSIRGISPSSSILSVDPSVGVFIDGVYLPTGAGVVFDTFDLASVEILRGPQGVLQGRNVVGGAVLMSTTQPSDEFSAELSVRGDSRWEGTGEDMTYTGLVTGPLTEDLNGKLAVYYNDDGGWFENEFNGDDIGDSETLILRGALSWLATDNLKFTLQYEYFDQEGWGGVYQAHERSGRNAATNVWRDGSTPFFEKGTHDVSSEMDGSGPYGLQAFADLEVNSFTLTTSYDIGFGDGTITNIFGWRDVEQAGLADVDGTPFTTFPSSNSNEVEHWSNELRYFGTFGSFDVTTGIYYLDVEIVDETQQSLNLASRPTQFLNRGTGGFQDSETKGVFSNVDYHISDTVTLSAGLRWTEEEKETRSYAYNGPNLTFTTLEEGPDLSPCGYVKGDGRCPIDFEDDHKWSNLSYRVAASWKRNDDTLLYAHVSTSYRAGNYSLRRTNIADQRQPVDEERMDQLEFGVKWDISERFRLNTSFFFLEASDLQRVTFSEEDASQIGLNAADARFVGVEVDGRAFLTDSLTLTFAFGHNDAKYTKAIIDINTDGTIDANDLNTPVQNTPELMYNFGLLHDTQISGFSLSSQMIYTHRDNVVNSQATQDRGSVDTIDANMTLISADDTWEVSLYGRNLTDKAIYTQSTVLGSLANSAHLSNLAKGRRIGMEFKYRFN